MKTEGRGLHILTLNETVEGGTTMPSRPEETAAAAAPVLALDIGNVCVQLDSTECARRLGYSSLDELIGVMPVVRTYARSLETGYLADAVFFSLLARTLPEAWSAAEVIPWWCSIIQAEIPGMAEVVDAAVARGLKPAFFSDISVTHLAYTRGLLSFESRVPDAVCSFEVGASKPDPRMYAAFEEQLCGGSTPALFVDDKPENVQQAQKRGWPAVVFTSPEALMEEVKNAGSR